MCVHVYVRLGVKGITQFYICFSFLLHLYPFKNIGKLHITSVRIGAWKCNFPPFQKIVTNPPTNRPTDRRTDGLIGKLHFQKDKLVVKTFDPRPAGPVDAYHTILRVCV